MATAAPWGASLTGAAGGEWPRPRLPRLGQAAQPGKRLRAKGAVTGGGGAAVGRLFGGDE